MKLIKNARMLMENGSFAQSMDILFDKKIIRTGSKLAEEYQSADCEIRLSSAMTESSTSFIPFKAKRGLPALNWFLSTDLQGNLSYDSSFTSRTL